MISLTDVLRESNDIFNKRRTFFKENYPIDKALQIDTLVFVIIKVIIETENTYNETGKYNIETIREVLNLVDKQFTSWIKPQEIKDIHKL